MPATSLADLLAEHAIKLKRQSAGHTEQIVCLRCDGGRTRETSLSVTIDDDGHGAVWTCHRGTCGWSEGCRVRGAPATPQPRETVILKPQPTPLADQTKPDWLYRFFAERQIGARTVDHFGIYAVKRSFAELGERDAIVFPYVAGSELVNRKYRPHPEKQPQQQDRDALQTLFNVDALGEAPDEIVWVEGEPDVMAMFESGIPNAVTLKDGAAAPKADGTMPQQERRFEALRTHEALLATAKRIILAGDMDAPGLAV